MEYATNILNENITWCHAGVAPTPDFTVIDYGLLYNWYAATDARNIANMGWHVPTIAEYLTLLLELDPTGVHDSYANAAGGKLKETGLVHWDNPNSGATNETGFNGRGQGMRSGSGGALFSLLNKTIGFWSTNGGGGFGNDALLSYDQTGLFVRSAGGSSYRNGEGIRLLCDSSTDPGLYTGNDGKIYATVKIGTQVFTASNIGETKYRDGTVIPEVTGSAAWVALATGAWCYYNNDPAYM